jgi:hypothetical protein
MWLSFGGCLSCWLGRSYSSGVGGGLQEREKREGYAKGAKKKTKKSTPKYSVHMHYFFEFKF